MPSLTFFFNLIKTVVKQQINGMLIEVLNYRYKLKGPFSTVQSSNVTEYNNIVWLPMASLRLLYVHNQKLVNKPL